MPSQPFVPYSCQVVCVAISRFLIFVKSATPNQYNRKKGIPGIKNRNKISNPFGKFILVMKIKVAEKIPNKLNSIFMIGHQILIRCNLYKCNESHITDIN